MSRAQAVLKQFLEDATRLLREIDFAFSDFSGSVKTAQGRAVDVECESLLALYRPIHSLKGISLMVEAARPLAKALHEFENCLPPLIRSVDHGPGFDPNLIPKLEALLGWSKRFVALLESKQQLLSRISCGVRGEAGLSFAWNGERIWIGLEEIHGFQEPQVRSAFPGGDYEWGEKTNAIIGIGIQVDEAHCLWVWLPEVPQTASFSEEKKRFPALKRFRETFESVIRRAS